MDIGLSLQQFFNDKESDFCLDNEMENVEKIRKKKKEKQKQ